VKALVHYLPKEEESCTLAKRCVESMHNFEGWSPELIEGFSPGSCTEISVPPTSYLSRYTGRELEARIACFSNHLRFWQKVVELNQAMCFIEHDAMCVSDFIPPSGDYAYLIRNTDGARNRRGIKIFRKYPIQNQWYKSNVFPSTCAYYLTPQGANRLLLAYEKYGAEKSDLFINSMTADLQEVHFFDMVPGDISYSSGDW